jgi:NAD(P)-dependent dehydrogenase (short-subunit alcohol dehydrogenase family)
MKFQLPDELIFLKNGKAIQKKSYESMAGKVCIITGATSGVGLESAKRLANGGAHIVMVCRNREKAENISSMIKNEFKVPADIIIADLASLHQVRKAANVILDSYKKIDVLINNAGIHCTVPAYTPEDFELVFCVNHLASFLLTRMLIERLKDSAPSRIIQVNSEGHRFGGLDLEDICWKKRRYNGYRSYGASKTAQLLTAWEFADHLKGSGVTINAMHPGDVKTNIGNNNGWLYKLFYHLLIRPLLKDPVISGEAIYYLASAPDMASVSGRFFNLTIDEKPARHALDRSTGKKIWDMSIQMTKSS